MKIALQRFFINFLFFKYFYKFLKFVYKYLSCFAIINSYNVVLEIN